MSSVPVMFIVYGIIYSGVYVVGTFGNILVVCVVAQFSSMQTATNIYLLSLSVADLLYMQSLVPYCYSLFNEGNSIPSAVVCNLFYFLYCVNWFAGTFSLAALSFDRFLAVMYPFKSVTFRTPQKAMIGTTILWILSLLLQIPTVVNAELKVHETVMCIISWDEKGPPIIFTFYTFVFGFVVPTTAIIVFYSLMLHRIHHSGPRGGSQRSISKRTSQRKTTQLVFIVVITFIVCWLPYWINQLRFIPQWLKYNDFQTFDMANSSDYFYASNFLESKYDAILSSNGSYTTNLVPEELETGESEGADNYSLHMHMSHFFQLLGYLNSAINPIIYAFLSPSFRKSFQAVLIRGHPRAENFVNENCSHIRPSSSRFQRPSYRATNMATEPVNGHNNEDICTPYTPLSDVSERLPLQNYGDYMKDRNVKFESVVILTGACCENDGDEDIPMSGKHTSIETTVEIIRETTA